LLNEEEYIGWRPNAKIIYLGKNPGLEFLTKSKKGNTWEMASFTFQSRIATTNIKISKEQGVWLADMLQKLSVQHIKTYTLQELKDSYETAGLEDFELFWDNKPVNTLYKFGLLSL
jgi:hypothetical protein